MELEAIRYGIGMTTMEDGFDPIQAAMYFTTAQLVYIITTGISKLGVGLVLFRLTSGTDMRIVRVTLMVSMIIVTLWCLATALIFGL
ncbi:hypothetical protein ACHAQD_011782 [Fusarium lateritium]